METAVIFDAAKIITPLVAGIGIGWKIFAWRHDRRTHLDVSVSNKLPIFNGRGPGEWCFSVDVVNRGLQDVVITAAGFKANDGTDRNLFLVQPEPGSTLPGIIRGRRAGSAWQEMDELERQGFDVYGEIVAFVSTDTGETFRSKPVTLRSR